jgi:hypothetical protein
MNGGDRRYSPVVSASKQTIIGDPDEDKICTSRIERANPLDSHGTGRFARLTMLSVRGQMHRRCDAFFADNLIKHSSVGNDAGDGHGSRSPDAEDSLVTLLLWRRRFSYSLRLTRSREQTDAASFREYFLKA